MYAEADYREGTTAYMWIRHKITNVQKESVRENAKISIYAQAGNTETSYNYYI